MPAPRGVHAVVGEGPRPLPSIVPAPPRATAVGRPYGEGVPAPRGVHAVVGEGPRPLPSLCLHYHGEWGPWGSRAGVPGARPGGAYSGELPLLPNWALSAGCSSASLRDSGRECLAPRTPAEYGRNLPNLVRFYCPPKLAQMQVAWALAPWRAAPVQGPCQCHGGRGWAPAPTEKGAIAARLWGGGRHAQTAGFRG